MSKSKSSCNGVIEPLYSNLTTGSLESQSHPCCFCDCKYIHFSLARYLIYVNIVLSLLHHVCE